jgi:hypothetical protein
MAQTSNPGSPSAIQFESASPTPPPWLNPAVVVQTPDRTHQRVAVGSKSERPVDDLFDADALESGKVLEPQLQARRDAIDIRRQQIVAEVPRRFALGPGHASFLVGAHEHAVALLAHVDLAFEVDCVKHFILAFQNFRHVFRDQVLMLHGENGKLEPHHATHLPRP